MASKLQFINSSGSESSTDRREQKRLAKSHITARRHYEQRQRNVEEHKRQRSTFVNSFAGSGSDTSSPSFSTETPNNTTTKDIPIGAKNTPQVGNRLPVWPPLSPNLFGEGHRTGPPNAEPSVDDELRLEQEGGRLINLPLTISPFPFALLGQGTSDPFIKLPDGINPRMSKHLWYYTNVLMPALHPAYSTNLVRRTFGCVSLRHADDLTLACISAFAATSRAHATGDLQLGVNITDKDFKPGFHESVQDWLYFKGKTIKMINERLSRGINGDAVSEPVVGGICTLILMETFTGNIAEATMHMNGVRRIASVWQNQRHQPMPYKLAAMIIACIVKLGTLTTSPPATPFYLNFYSPLPFPLPNISQLLPDLGTMLIRKWPLINPVPPSYPKRDFAPVLHDLTLTTRYTEAVASWNFPYVEDDSYMEFVNYKNLYLEHRMLNHSPEDQSVIEECIRIACILFLNTVLVRGYPVESAIIQNMLRPYREVVERSIEADDNLDSVSVLSWVGFEDILLWILFIGVYCSCQKADQEFFVSAFRKAAASLGLDSAEEARALLSGFFFVDRVYLPKLKEVYNLAG